MAQPARVGSGSCRAPPRDATAAMAVFSTGTDEWLVDRSGQAAPAEAPPAKWRKPTFPVGAGRGSSRPGG
eukprot:9532823-Lingulodinium_polyedra.AAC.1